MMRRALPLATGLGLLLAGCNLFGLGPSVSGSFRGDWSGVDTARTRIALVGLTSGFGFSNQAVAQITDFNLAQGYTLALPETAPEGSYTLVAYTDLNNNRSFDPSEDQLVGRLCDRGLIYASAAGSRWTLYGTLQLQAGWNGVRKEEGGWVAFQKTAYAGFDLYRSCP